MEFLLVMLHIILTVPVLLGDGMVATWSAIDAHANLVCRRGRFLRGQVYFYTLLVVMLRCDAAQNLFFLSFTHLAASFCPF